MSVVHAADCSPVNLITEEASPFTKIPVYDQKDSNICYAYAAAQMVDYHLLKNGAEKRSIHPVWLALNYALGKNRKGLDIGHTKDSIEKLTEVHNCDFEAVSTALKDWAGSNDLPESKIIAFIEKYSDSDRTPASTDALTQKMLSDLRKISMNPVQVVSKIIMPFCQMKTKVSVPKVNKYNYTQLPDDVSYEHFLLERLSKNPSPISIAYCSKVWKEPGYDGIDLTFFGKRDSLKKDCEYHESLVVGKKTSAGSCQILVRNTWGDRWRVGNKKWKCLCKERSTGKFVDDCEASTHPDDQFAVEACWINSDKLSKNVGVVTVTE